MNARTERLLLGMLLLIFTCFTWRLVTMFYTGDDLMNTSFLWGVNPWTIGKAQFMVWIPMYRPLGGAIYQMFYAVFGFHPAPLYVFCWLLLAANVIFAYRFFKTIAGNAAEALLALSLTLVHGALRELYVSAGTMYDSLCFLFTTLGMVAYIRMRRDRTRIPLSGALLVFLLCLLAMDSKESGVALPVLLAVYECIFILPEVWQKRVAWLRDIAPLYGALAALSLAFVFLRVDRTPELTANTAYHTHPTLGSALTRIAEYFGMLTYGHLVFSAATAGALLAATALVALLARNRIMIFGWIFFVISIAPVSLIISRPGYVLYVPDLGLGLYLAAAIAGLVRPIPRAEFAAFAVVTIAMVWFHVRNWPQPIDPHNAEYRLTEQFRREYPTLPRGTRLLFVKDDFPKDGFDILFNLRLLYHDRTLVAHRLQAPPDQQPDPKHLNDHDHVFSVDSGRYFELDNRNVAESIRLKILRDFAVGRQMVIARRDYPAYIISGVNDGDPKDSGRWTQPHATLKFDVYPAPAIFSTKFWAPDFMTKSGVRTLDVLVNGNQIGSLRLSKDGLNEVSFPVAADAISPTGYTMVELNVDNPWKEPSGEQLGVILMEAGFQYVATVQPAKRANAAHVPGP